MLLLDERGKIQQANQAAIQIFGLRDDQETSLDDLRIYSLDEKPATWDFVVENVAALPVMVSGINNKTGNKLVFQFALKVLKFGRKTAYFLTLTF